jgi:N utilization substance protein B
MLNRRILRVKVLKSLYAFKQAQKATFQLCLDNIVEHFMPDLNAMENPEPEEFKEWKEAANKIFKANYLLGEIEHEEGMTAQEARDVAQKEIEFYQSEVSKDQKNYKKAMLNETDEIYDTYLSFILLLVELSEFVLTDHREWQKRQLLNKVILKSELKLADNQVIKAFKKSHTLEQFWEQKNLSWGEELIRAWYKLLREDETYKTYQNLPVATFEQDKEIVDYIVRQFILKNDVLVSHFEQDYIDWQENKSVLKNMLIKTVKGVTQNQEEEVELHRLSGNWYDDREFFKELYEATFKYESVYDKAIDGKTHNWDIERLATMDKIILNMAVAEMIHYPSIPIKVSINEYLELAKG